MTPTGDVPYVTVVVRVPVARIRRLRTRFGARFLARCFTESEQTHALRRRHADRALAARWAARSAVRVALRELGDRAVVDRDDAVIVHDARGAPALRLGGALIGRLSVAGLSLAHDGDDAIAALLVGGGAGA